MNHIVCVFCPLKGTQVLNFTEETLNKCEYVLECRKTHKLVGKDVPRQTGGVPLIWRQTGETCLLSSQIDCWISFMLVQVNHSRSVKLQIHPPWQNGGVQLIWRQTGENHLISSQIDFWVILCACTDESPSSGGAKCSPTLKLPLFRDPTGRPVVLLFPSYNLSKI